MQAPGTYRTHRGFTLIEMMTMLAVVAVMMVVATPQFTRFQRNAELSSSANTLLASLIAARSEAMKRGQTAFVQPLDGVNWAAGWRAYVDTNGNQQYDAGTDYLIAELPALPALVVMDVTNKSGFLDSGKRYVAFTGSGFPQLKSGSFLQGSVDFNNGTEVRRLSLSLGGRMRVCKPTSASADC